MLKCFFTYTNIPEVIQVREVLRRKKLKLQKGDFRQPFEEINDSELLFQEIKNYAIGIGNEELANAQYVAHIYLTLFCQISSFFDLLGKKEYKTSWNALQDCFDSVHWIGQYTPIENRYEIPKLVDLLIAYESLYPYKVFASSEMIISKSECSICGKPFQSLSCPHIKGKLYWGEIAVERITDIKEFQAVALVSHPADKRCVMELSDDNRTEEEKFHILNEFLCQGVPAFQFFEVEVIKSTRRRSDIVIVGRNEKCPCGSGKKFKWCCGQELYYEHLHHIIHLKEQVVFEKN